MNITITINTDNAAFEDNPHEVADILRNTWGKLVSLTNDQIKNIDWLLKDHNGNSVGIFRVTD